MQEQIPEWKRGALTVSDQPSEEERKGLFGKLKHSVKEKINQTEGAKRFYESENYKKVKDIKDNYQEFRQKLSEQIEEAQNPVVQSTRMIADSLLRESSTASAVREMQKYDPTFDL